MTDARRREGWRRPSTIRLGALLLAALAYVPALASSPGKMPADTKLYLYLDPGQLISDASKTWDNRQFLGWVPHQIIAYLWPAGPWFWVFEKLGVPDWVAQRLWIGTLLFLGGLGVLWAARRLGLTATGAISAALAYQLSPYVLPYISRTSVLLLPWAAVGWLTGLTVRAATRSKWRDPALIALVVLTVGAVNATALAMIVPAPLLWLIHAAWQRTISWRRALATALRVGALSLFVSLWWIVMLVVQGHYGADVLSYSETLDAVSLTSVTTEVLRGLGYWLFYVRDPYAFTTTSSVDYLASGRVIFAGFALLVLALLGLAIARWTQRRYAVLLVLCGVVLAVGVHPLGDPAPLIRPLATSGLGLALRSSTRAIPLSAFGLALGIGALVAAVGRLRWRWRVLAPFVVAGLAIVNLPSLWHHTFVDPALARDEQPPAAWDQATAALDASNLDARVLQLPGQEFGAFRWGYTVDPPLPGLTKKPLATRDLLPLGSPGAMDLLDALDDRLQTGTIEPAEIAPVARMLGADTIWLSNDAAFERFRTARPEVVAALFAAGVPGIGPITSYGTPAPNLPVLAMVDETALATPSIGEPLPPVQLAGVEDAPGIVRASSRLVVLSGSGDGVVDAAGAGLLHGDEALLYAADVRPSDDLANAAQVIVTDSNRDRAHQWRGSQDVTGFTEAGGTDGGLLRTDEADKRLPVFPGETAADETTATLATGLVVRASGYGEPFAYRPEQRPAMAVDGDPSTAWVVGDRADPVGEYLEVSHIDGRLTLLQPQDTVANRMITRIRVESLDHATPAVDVALDGSSLTGPGQVVAGLPTGAVRIMISAIAARPGGTDTGPSAVGFAELGLGTNQEVVNVPTGVLRRTSAATPTSIVLTRLRTDPLDRWRSDPEPTLVRGLSLPSAVTTSATVTLRLDRRASDGVLAGLTGQHGAISDRRLTGDVDAAAWHAVDGDPATAWTSPFVDPVGSALTLRLQPGVRVGPLTIHQPLDDVHSRITRITVAVGGQAVDLDVPAPDAGGASTVQLPAVEAASMVVTVAAVDAATTVDRRYGEVTTLPVAITELDDAALDRSAAAGAQPAQPACRTDLLHLDGQPVPLAVGAAQVAQLVAGQAVTVSTCDGSPIALGAGRHVLASVAGVATGIDVDRVVLSSGVPAPVAPDPTIAVQRSDDTRTATVGACPAGCWMILGEGYDKGWTAGTGGRSLGAPRQLAGGFNAWWLPPSGAARTVTMTWQPQTELDIALAASALGIVICLLLVWRGRRGDPAAVPLRPDPPQFDVRRLWRPVGGRAAVISGAVLAVVSALMISWTFGIVGLVLGIVVAVSRRPLLTALGATGMAGVLGMIVLRRETVSRFFVNAGWPGHFEDLHRYGLLVVVLLFASVVADPPGVGVVADDDAGGAPAAADAAAAVAPGARLGD